MSASSESLSTLFDLVQTKYKVDLRQVDGVKSKESLTLLDCDRLEQANLGDEESQMLTLWDVKKFLQQDGFVVPYKLFNDPILGSIKVHPVALLIIDTPQFQRLRHISQLSPLNYVYPGANGTRFEHSIGVYHLAGQLINTLRENQPELKITLIDCLCVELAGLCHDLGHGPFSHLFEGVIRELDSNREWKHEEASIKMLEYLFSDAKVKDGFELWGFQPKDMEFIKSLILCKPDGEKTGRKKEKSFLYEIVANERNGMDVDKWDYIPRDASYLGIKTHFECERLMHHMRIIDVDGEKQICVRDKEMDSLFSLFFTRYSLHKKAYQHPVSRCAEVMLTDAIVKAALHLKIRGKTILECIDDMEAYTRLNDSIFYKILDSECEDLRESREILERLEKRQLYKCIAQAEIKEEKEEHLENLRKKLKEDLKRKIEDATGKMFVVKYNTGKRNENPLDHVRFYSKDKPNEAHKLTQKSILFPSQFQDRAIAAYCTSKDIDGDIYDKVKKIFEDEGLNLSMSHG